MTNIPYGYCHCGCGEKTKIATKTDRHKGHTRGEPQRYLPLHHRRKSFIEWVEDPETGCWLWQRAKAANGYGTAYNPTTKRNVKAHRWIYEKHRGPIPEGLQLDHLCRNPSCVNPDHLEPVTNAENQRRGLNATLTEDAVRFIRSTDLSKHVLAERFGVSAWTIWAVRARHNWVDVA